MEMSAQAFTRVTVVASAPAYRGPSSKRLSFRSSSAARGGPRFLVAGRDGEGRATAERRRPLQVAADVRKEWRSRRSLEMLVKSEDADFPFANYIAVSISTKKLLPF